MSSTRPLSWSAKVKERDGHTCVICGAPGVHAHHIKSASYHDELKYDVHNGVTLCRRCHILAHMGSFNALHPRMSARETFAALKSRAGGRDVDTLIDRLIIGANDMEDGARIRYNQPAPPPRPQPSPDSPW